MDPAEKQRIKEDKAVAREAAKEAKKMEKEAAKDAKRLERERIKTEKAAAKEAARAAEPPKKRGRPPKVKPEAEAPASTYGKLDLLRGFAEEVYTSLGAGHLESIYHAAMAVELRMAGIAYESEQIIPVTHKGTYVGTVRADIIVNKECVLEFKISGKLDDAKQQARQYMKLRNIAHGFVVMFPKSDGGVVQFVDARAADDE